MKTTIPHYLGASSDLRTSKWRIECPKCGHKFQPNTTRMAKQFLDCPIMKCGAQMIADYNNDIVKLIGED